jgi:hypothetical protein
MQKTIGCKNISEYKATKIFLFSIKQRSGGISISFSCILEIDDSRLSKEISIKMLLPISE